jgi:hypothetical protein
MPTESPLVLAVLAGYIFIQRFHLSRFWAQSLDGWHLVYQSSIAGILLIAPSRFLILLINKTGLCSFLWTYWHEFAGATPFLGTTALVFLAAPVLAGACNLFLGIYAIWRVKGLRMVRIQCWAALQQPKLWKRKLRTLRDEISTAYALNSAINAKGTSLEQLLYNAAQRAIIEKQTVCLAMADGKVYVGWVAKSPSLRISDNFVWLAPLMSGHRAEKSLELTFNVIYPESDPPTLVVLPTPDIQSARIFDVKAYYNGL